MRHSFPFNTSSASGKWSIDVHLLVHERTRAELSAAFAQDLDRLHFVSDSVSSKWCAKIPNFVGGRLSGFITGTIVHLDTQVRQHYLAKSLSRKYHFDVIHEPIPVSPKLPSMLFGLSVPVIVGPMNGGMDYPPNYNLDSRLYRMVRDCLRSTAAFWNFVLPGKRQAASVACCKQAHLQRPTRKSQNKACP